MARLDAKEAISQIETLTGIYQEMQARSKYNDLSDLPNPELTSFAIRLVAAVTRLTTPTSTYRMASEATKGKTGYVINEHIGILDALKADIESGWLQTVAELVHGETLDDILSMATELADNGYKDAAAVISGTALEVHLRSMALKAGIEVENDGKPRKADRINADLAKAEVFSKLEQKNVTAHLGLRNAAAHGEYDSYDARDVARLIEAVRDFASKYPA